MRLTNSSVLVLKAFLDQAMVARHGYELMQVTRLASGTLYPLLMRLEDSGLLSSTWEASDPKEEGRPRRRLYKITGAGAAAAQNYFAQYGLALS